MEIHIDFSNNHFDMSFIPIDFYSLESIFGQLPVSRIKNLSLGIFPNDNPQDDFYYDQKDVYKVFPNPVVNLEPLFRFLKKLEDRESFSVYKLEVDFGIFQVLYDDDSFLSVTGQFSTKEEFETINSIYRKFRPLLDLKNRQTAEFLI